MVNMISQTKLHRLSLLVLITSVTLANAFVLINSGLETDTTTGGHSRSKRSSNCMNLSALSNSVIGLPMGQVLNESAIQDIMDLEQAHHLGTINYNSSTCPDTLLDTDHLTIKMMNRLNICPWVYTTDIDDERYPREITVAQCYCPYCIKTDNSGFDTTSNTACRPVFHRVHVLRKCNDTCTNGVCKYQPDYELIPVACACVRPVTEE